MRFITLTFLILTVQTFVIAQNNSVISLSIEEAQQYAIKHNKSLRNTRADIDLAQKRYWETLAQGLPQVSGNADYTDFFNYQIEFGMMGGGDIPAIDLNLLDAGDMEIMKLLSGFISAEPTVIKMSNSATAQLQLSQLVFSGQYIAGIQLAKIGKFLAEKNLIKSEIDIKESIVGSYYMALMTEESVNFLQANIDNLNETKTQTNAMLNVGLIEEIDVDQLQMTITMLENTRRAMLRNKELSYNILKFQLGMDAKVQLALTDNLSSVMEKLEFETLMLQEFIPQQNITYKLLEAQEEMSEKMIDMERWSYAPSIIAAYSYNQKILTTDFDMNPRNLLTFRLSVPIFSSGMRKARVDQRRIELYQLQNTREIVLDQMLMQEKQLRYNLLSAFEQYNSQKENLELAKRIYNHNDKKFRFGVISSLELTQSNSNVIQAESNYLSAMLELLQAKLNFDKLLNNL